MQLVCDGNGVVELPQLDDRIHGNVLLHTRRDAGNMTCRTRPIDLRLSFARDTGRDSKVMVLFTITRRLPRIFAEALHSGEMPFSVQLCHLFFLQR